MFYEKMQRKSCHYVIMVIFMLASIYRLWTKANSLRKIGVNLIDIFDFVLIYYSSPFFSRFFFFSLTNYTFTDFIHAMNYFCFNEGSCFTSILLTYFKFLLLFQKKLSNIKLINWRVNKMVVKNMVCTNGVNYLGNSMCLRHSIIICNIILNWGLISFLRAQHV